MAKAARLGIKHPRMRPWKEWEDRYLERKYNILPIQSIARTLKRSIPAIRGRAKMLRLTASQAREWTDKEKIVLRELYSDFSNSLDDIAELLNRTRNAVLLQAQALNLSRPQHEHLWSKEEHDYLVKHFKKKSYREIAEALGLSVNAVSHHANRSGLRQRPKGKPWTEEDKEFVRRNYKKMPTKEIAAALGRTVNAIITIVGPLGVSNGRPRPWSEAEKNYLRENYGSRPLAEIAAHLKRSESAVKSAVTKLKLGTPRRKKQTKQVVL